VGATEGVLAGSMVAIYAWTMSGMALPWAAHTSCCNHPSCGCHRRPPGAISPVDGRCCLSRTAARPMGSSSPEAGGGVELPLGRCAQPVRSRSREAGGHKLPRW
jgi:hypothetical protein